MINWFPARARLFTKANVNVIKKLDYPGQDILLHIDSNIEYDTRRFSCAKEPETIEWIESFFKSGDVFYDVGANVGTYSLVAAKFLAGKVCVYALEPGFLNYAQLCRNLLLNNCQGCITPLPIALSDRNSIDVFNYQNVVVGGALHALGPAIDYKGEPFSPVCQLPVLTYRLDDLINQYELPAPNHLKIDVDGTEYQVLIGAKSTLEKQQLRSIIIELEESRPDTNQVCELLQQKGFLFRSKHEQQSNVFNYIFCRESPAKNEILN